MKRKENVRWLPYEWSMETAPKTVCQMIVRDILFVERDICEKSRTVIRLDASKGNASQHRPYSRRGHDGQKERLGLQIYRKFARQYVHCDATSLLLHVPVM